MPCLFAVNQKQSTLSNQLIKKHTRNQKIPFTKNDNYVYELRCDNDFDVNSSDNLEYNKTYINYFPIYRASDTNRYNELSIKYSVDGSTTDGKVYGLNKDTNINDYLNI